VHGLSVKKQWALLKLNRFSIYYRQKAFSEADLDLRVLVFN